MRAAIAILFLISTAWAELIPSARLVTWTPGTHTGVPGGIPTTRTMYVNAKTGELGAGGTYGGTLAAADGTTDDTAAINAMLASCPADKYVYLPAGTYRTAGQLVFVSNNVSLKGAGESLTILMSESSIAIRIGPDIEFAVLGSAANSAVSAGLSKGSTSLTIGSTASLSLGQMVMINQNTDDTVPQVVLGGFRYQTKQIVRVETIPTATTFTFSPGLYDSYGGGSVDVRVLATASQREGIGIEDLRINFENAADGQVGIKMQVAYACWAKGVRVVNCKNYPFFISDSFRCEMRRCFADARTGSGTNGGGFLMGTSSACLIEDNIVNLNDPDMEINGGSGNFISRNFCYSGGFLNSNHAPFGQFNLYEGNVTNGFKSDGYFGGERYGTYFNNKVNFISLYRFTRDATAVGNVIGDNYADAWQSTGLPNFGNTSFTGTSTYYSGDYSDPWRDFNMTGDVASVTNGTGSGYQTVGSYSTGATAITIDTGSGTILADDIVSFAGSSSYRYKVVSFSGGVLTIGASNTGAVGLQAAVSDNEAVTLSSDHGTITFDSGQLYSFNGFSYQYVVLHWGGFATWQRYRVSSVTGNVATIIPDIESQPNSIALPAAATPIDLIGQAYYENAFQEKDLAVELTLIRKGNRYTDAFDSLGGDTMPDSLAYSAKPAWLTAAETELGATFNLRPFDPVGGTSASDSDIPAGYRYTFLLEPVHTSASINVAGTELSIATNKPVQVGAGGGGGVTLSGGGVTATYDRTSGSATIFTLSRVITEGESFTVSYTQPGNGFEDVNGNDLPSFSDLVVSNASDVTTGVVYYGPELASMTGTGDAGDSAVMLLQKVVAGANGTAVAVRVYCEYTTGETPMRVVICSADGTVLTSGPPTPPGDTGLAVYPRWISMAVNSIPITQGTTYLVGVQTLGVPGNPLYARRTGQPSNTSYTNSGTPFGSSIPASYSLTGSTDEWAFQMRATVDPPEYTVGKIRLLRR